MIVCVYHIPTALLFVGRSQRIVAVALLFVLPAEQGKSLTTRYNLFAAVQSFVCVFVFNMPAVPEPTEASSSCLLVALSVCCQLLLKRIGSWQDKTDLIFVVVLIE